MIHITRFIDKIKLYDTKSSNQFRMTLQEAKDLHSDITKLLMALHKSSNKSSEITKVEIKGQDW
jgi:hypothetical protein